MPSLKKIEELEDKQLICEFIIPGNPATKKNSNQIIWIKRGKRKMPKVIPSAQYTRYEKHCKEYCYAAWKDKHYDPINFGIIIRVKVWLNAWRLPDHVGILQSLGDIFQKWGILADDKYIQWTDFNFETNSTDMWLAGVDKENPRVEVWIYRYRNTVEQYGINKAASVQASQDRRAMKLKSKTDGTIK